MLAIDRKGVVASKIVKGGVTGDKVAKFFETLPNNRPVILDNYIIHNTEAVREVCDAKEIGAALHHPLLAMVQSRGARIRAVEEGM